MPVPCGVRSMDSMFSNFAQNNLENFENIQVGSSQNGTVISITNQKTETAPTLLQQQNKTAFPRKTAIEGELYRWTEELDSLPELNQYTQWSQGEERDVKINCSLRVSGISACYGKLQRIKKTLVIHLTSIWVSKYP